jgi:hypothetical protein
MDLHFSGSMEEWRKLFGSHCCEDSNIPAAPLIKAPQNDNSHPHKEKKPAGFWQIPYVAKKFPREYENAMTICKRYNLPYPQAIELWKKDHPKKTQTPGISKPSFSDGETSPESEKTVQNSLKETASENDNPPVPDPAPAPDPEPINSNSNGGFKKGDIVIQKRPDRGVKKLYQSGEVIESRGGIVKVRDKANAFLLIPAECLAPAEV